MAALDEFSAQVAPGAIDAPARRIQEVVPSDSTDLTYVSRAIFCGSGGNLVVLDMLGQEKIFTNLQAGQLLPIRVTRIRATSSSAPRSRRAAAGSWR